MQPKLRASVNANANATTSEMPLVAFDLVVRKRVFILCGFER